MSDSGSTFGIAGRAVACWMLAALVARLLALAWAGPSLPCSYDECSYIDLAANLASGGGYTATKGFLWPPGYTTFLAPLVGAEGQGIAAARLVQSILAVLIVPAVAYFVAACASGPLLPAATHVACGLVALDPTLVAYAHLLWPETLFLILFTTAVALALRSGGRTSRLLAAGVLFGVSALLKSVGFWLLLPLAPVLPESGRRGQRLRAAAILLGGAVLTVAPWTVRNAIAYRSLVLLDVTAGTNLRLGNGDSPPVTWDWGAFERTRARDPEGRCPQSDFIERDRCEQRRAVEWMASHPGAFAARALIKWADLVNPTSFLVRHVRAGRYSGRPMAEIGPATAAAVTAAAACPWIAVCLLAVPGLALGSGSAARRATLTVVATLLLMAALTFGMSRLRLPAFPLLAAWAGLQAARLRAGVPGSRRPVTVVVSVLAIVALILLWTSRLGPLLDFSPWSGTDPMQP